MPELSKIVKQRLQAAPRPQVHPTPDLLGAFAENSLPPAERTQVLEHLAGCAECREVVSLSSSVPESELEHLVAAAAASDGAALRRVAAVAPVPMALKAARPRWPMFRWAGLAATVAIVMVGATVLMRQERVAKQQIGTYITPSKTQPAPAPPAAEPALAGHAADQADKLAFRSRANDSREMGLRAKAEAVARSEERLDLDKKAAVTRDQAKRELALVQPPTRGGAAGATASGSLADMNRAQDEIFTGKPSEAAGAKIAAAAAAPAPSVPAAPQTANTVSEVAIQEVAKQKDASAAQPGVAPTLTLAQTEQNFKSVDQLEADAELRQVMQQMESEKKTVALKSSAGNLRKNKDEPFQARKVSRPGVPRQRSLDGRKCWSALPLRRCWAALDAGEAGGRGQTACREHCRYQICRR